MKMIKVKGPSIQSDKWIIFHEFMNIDAEYINDIINLLISGLNIDKTQIK